MFPPVQTVRRTILHDRLNLREAAALEPSIRGFMESRFRTGFGDVRIHTGPAAARLCDQLQARAFTLGRDIVFGEGQFAPASEAGQCLLAHELVHVLQQRSARPPGQSTLVPVGDPRDTWESEADQLAEEALGTGLRSPVTPDATGALRRAIRVLADSALMDVNKENMGPGTYVDMRLRKAFLYLNKNGDMDASGINIWGKVEAQVSPGDDLSKWDFRFIQLSRDIVCKFRYAGRQSSHGSLAVDWSIAPARPADFVDKFTLDSEKSVMPFTNLRRPNIAPQPGGRVTIETDMDDHPQAKMNLVFRNATTNKDNYLRSAWLYKEFITALVVRDPQKVIQPLAFFVWNIRWGATYHWEDNTGAQGMVNPRDLGLIGGRLYSCYSKPTDMGKYVSTVFKGAPSDKELRAMITNPTKLSRETSNELSDAARTALDTPGIWNVQHYNTWLGDVPADFFR